MRLSDTDVAAYPPSADRPNGDPRPRRTRPDPLLSADPLTKGPPPPAGPSSLTPRQPPRGEREPHREGVAFTLVGPGSAQAPAGQRERAPPRRLSSSSPSWPAPAPAGAHLRRAARRPFDALPQLHRRPQQEAAVPRRAGGRSAYLRLDFAVGIVFRWDGTDFSAVDRIDELAARYRIGSSARSRRRRGTSPAAPAAPPITSAAARPPPRYEATWRDMVFQIVRRARNVRHWELGNEPDIGTLHRPAVGLRPLGVARRRRHPRRPAQGDDRDRRVLAARPGAYIGDRLRDPAHPLIGRFDIANVHVRGHARGR